MSGRRRLGFSLIELLVVLAIINVILLLVFPAVQMARESANRTVCASNLRQIGIALHNYHETHRTFPIANLPLRYWSWQAATLPFVEQGVVYDLINYSSGSANCFEALRAEGDAGFASAGAKNVRTFICPSDPNGGVAAGVLEGGYRYQRTMSYLGVSGSRINVAGSCNSLDSSRDGMMFSHFIHPLQPECNRYYSPMPTSIRDASDGTANTLIVGERGVPRTSDGYFNLGWLLCGTGYNNAGEGDHVLSVGGGFHAPNLGDYSGRVGFSPGTHFWSYHPGGGNFLYVDGSVRFHEYAMSLDLLRSLATRSGGD